MKPEVTTSPALSLFARPGDGSIATRRIAIMVADGCDAAPVLALTNRLTAQGAVPRFLSTRLGTVEPASGDVIEVDVSLEATPSVLYDALVIAGGAATQLRADGRSLEFIKDQYPTLQTDPDVWGRHNTARRVRYLCDAAVGGPGRRAYSRLR